MTAPFITGRDLVSAWLTAYRAGKPPPRFHLAEPFADLEVRPGQMVLIGGPPGSGKTAALVQIGVDLLRKNEQARLLFANVEMAPLQLLERIVARLAGVPLTTLINRTVSPIEQARVEVAVSTLESIGDRLAFLGPPYSLKNLAEVGTTFRGNVLVIDYIQRFTVDEGKGDKREQIEAAAAVLRRFCDAGAAVLVASAVARQRSATGSTYRGLNLASFRGSSELEYSSDSAYLLIQGDSNEITLRCEKNRYGPVADIVARFEPSIQSFSPAAIGLDRFDAVPEARQRGLKAKEG